MSRPTKAKLWMVTSLSLAAGAGVLGSVALGAGSAAAPSTTATITLTNGGAGPPGPPGPAGPQGPAGEVSDCPKGSTFGELVINHPGGHVSILTCIVND